MTLLALNKDMTENQQPSDDQYEAILNHPDLPFLRHTSSGTGGLFGGEEPTALIPTGAFRDMYEDRGTFAQLEPYVVSSYDLDGNTMMIRDAVWGEELIDGPHSDFDTLLMRLARSALFRRTQAIEQLTLGKNFATVPSTTYMSRWSHIWGSLIFIRKMNEGRDIDPRINQTMQLRTLLSDVGHTAFSHLGDWMFQEAGSEDLHDRELKNILTVSGVKDILSQHGFSLDETVFPDVKDWVECPSPDLNVDRVDYGLREMLRWQTSFTGLNYYQSKLANPQSLFEIVDDNLVVKDPNFATKFAIGYSVLPTEHWAQPAHRLQLQLLQMAMRRIITQKLDVEGGHPRDEMYAVDNMFDQDFKTWDMMNLESIMKNLALTQRQIFAQGRKQDLDSIFRQSEYPLSELRAKPYVFPTFPDPLQNYTWESEQFIIPHAPNLIIESVDQIEVDPMTVTMQGLQIALPALKARIVDPRMLNEKGEVVRLSEYNPSYLDYLKGQRQEMSKAYLVTILMHSKFAEAVIAKDKEAMELWGEFVKRPRDPQRLHDKIAESEFWAAAHRFDHITDW
jgi:HD superfamily phosphohydrolase